MIISDSTVARLCVALLHGGGRACRGRPRPRARELESIESKVHATCPPLSTLLVCLRVFIVSNRCDTPHSLGIGTETVDPNDFVPTPACSRRYSSD